MFDALMWGLCLLIKSSSAIRGAFHFPLQLTIMEQPVATVPLNDVRKMKRSNSRGSEHEIEIESDGEGVDFRLQAICPVDESKKISLWHDISLVHLDPETKAETPYLNFVCEIPKFSRYARIRLSRFSFSLLLPMLCFVRANVDLPPTNLLSCAFQKEVRNRYG